MTENERERSRAPSLDRSHFASARLAPHLGTSALRAASRPTVHPHARRLHPYGLGVFFRCGSCHAPDRLSRRLFRPRLRLRPRFLEGEEGSTPWTRPPFTPRRSHDRPGLLTGEGASMKPAVVAYRLLQPDFQNDVRAHSRASTLASRRRPQPSSSSGDVVTCPLRGQGRRAASHAVCAEHPRIRFPQLRLGGFGNT